MTSEQAHRSLNHFGLYRFQAEFWRLSAAERRQALQGWLSGLDQAATRVHLYQVFPTEAGADLLLWVAAPVEAHDDPAQLLHRYAQATHPHRQLLEPVTMLWGFTAASVYSKARSAQEMDPFAEGRRRYLIAYPFAKTGPWYLKSSEARQGMMNEHIRLGKQFPEIQQLLLYSFGLQDHEFVVVYETDDLAQFSELVRQLRATDVRLYTAYDTPLHTAVYHPRAEGIDLWSQ